MVLQRMSQYDWYHVPNICGVADTPTCFKGSGSAIDHIFFNTLAMGAFESCAFGTSISDHCAIQFTITMGVLSQTILRNRSMTQLPDDFRFPEALPHAVCDLDSRFRSLLTKGDVSGSSKLTMVPIC